MAMIRAYHKARKDFARVEIIVPDAAHGTNPATATMCGCTVREIPTQANGDIDLESLKKANVVPAFAEQAKVVLSGEIRKAVTLKGVGATKGARAAIEAAGGKLEACTWRPRPAIRRQDLAMRLA